MWFKRKPRNRAFERRHVLDVKVARRQVRRMRVRVATLATSLSLGAILFVYIAWRGGEWALQRFVYENQAFNIEKIIVKTDGVIAPEQLLRWAGVRKNQNLFALDLHRVKRDLELVPAIQSVSVERVLPHTLIIDAIEREPVAHISDCLIDGSGFVMRPVDLQHRSISPQPSEHYPVISGVAQTDIRLGREVDSPQVRAALRFIAAFDRSMMGALVDLVRVDVSQPDVLTVYTAQQNEVTFRNTDFDRQLNRWWLIYEKGVQSSRQIGWLDLSVTENVPLRWLESPAVPPSPSKIRKNSPYKKKHV
jgi:cell division septal protein FtsQ